MKKFFTFFSVVALFISCTDEPVGEPLISAEGESEIIQSSGLRPILESIKEKEGIESKSRLSGKGPSRPLDFDFVYPVTFQLSDESVMQIMDYKNLVTMLRQESLEYHATAIGFPFEIRKSGTTKTIPMYERKDLNGLASSYDLELVSFDYVNDRGEPCFDIEYPLTLIVNNAPATFTKKSDAVNFLKGAAIDREVGMLYPYNVKLKKDGQSQKMLSDYSALYTINNACE